MEGKQKVIRLDSRVLYKNPHDKKGSDTECVWVVSYVYPDLQHVDIRRGFLGMLSMEYVPIQFIEAVA